LWRRLRRHGRGVERGGCSFKMRGNAAVLEAGVAGFGCLIDFAWRCGGGFAQLLGRFHHGLRAPGQAVDLSHAGFLLAGSYLSKAASMPRRTASSECRLRAMFRSAPVERGEQQQRAAPLLEALFDLGEVVEIVLHGLGLSPFTASVLRISECDPVRLLPCRNLVLRS